MLPVRENVFGSDRDMVVALLSGCGDRTGGDLAWILLLHDNERAKLQVASFNKLCFITLVKQRLG